MAVSLLFIDLYDVVYKEVDERPSTTTQQSAVAEMGDRGHKTWAIKRWTAVTVFLMSYI